MKRVAALTLALLAGCSGNNGAETSDNVAAPPDLERAAIVRGLVRDPADTDMTGLYARDTDRVCVVPDGSGARIGVFVDYGDGITCSGSGTVTRGGETLRVELGQGCAFDARYDGDRITFSGNVPDACTTLCTRNASFAAVEVERLSESQAEASALRDAKGRLLCAQQPAP